MLTTKLHHCLRYLDDLTATADAIQIESKHLKLLGFCLVVERFSRAKSVENITNIRRIREAT